MNDKIKNSIKKLLCLNLIRIFKQDILFVGSICDYIHTAYQLSSCRDIDIVINFDNKYSFFDKLFYSPFFIPGNQNYSIRLCNTHRYITNFGRHNTTYSNYNYFNHKYSYHLHIFGISLDINLIRNKPLYKPCYWNEPFICPHVDNSNLVLDNGMLVESPESRLCKLKFSAADHNLKTETKIKHLNKIQLYENNLNIQPNLFYDVDTFIMPESFDVYKYQKLNKELRFLSKDGAIDHFLAHGIEEQRPF